MNTTTTDPSDTEQRAAFVRWTDEAARLLALAAEQCEDNSEDAMSMEFPRFGGQGLIRRPGSLLVQ